MARYTHWENGTLATFEDYVDKLMCDEIDRRNVIWKMQHDLVAAAVDLGQSGVQIESKVDDLFSTFGAEWSIYILAGATAIIDAITNDGTLAWLDTEYPVSSGVSLRTRLINRLTNG